MNHQINMMGCDGDDECKYFGKRNFSNTKDTTIILGSAFLWAPFMQQTQTIRYGVQSKIIELLGTGKMSSFFAWVAGSATQASIVKAASDVTGPILTEEKIILKDFLEQFSDKTTKIFDFFGEHGKS